MADSIPYEEKAITQAKPSDTPRTDAELAGQHAEYYVTAKFARQLERALARYEQANANLKAKLAASAKANMKLLAAPERPSRSQSMSDYARGYEDGQKVSPSRGAALRSALRRY